jgi:RNA polymerase sigma factor (sigma-70 family)
MTHAGGHAGRSSPLPEMPSRPPAQPPTAKTNHSAASPPREVCALIDKLSLDQRNVLLLRIVGGLTVTEVAHALGKRQGAVKALQARGLAAIRKEMSTRGVTLSATTAFT